MPSRSSGRGKGTRKISFPTGLPLMDGPELRPRSKWWQRASMVSQTDPTEESAASTPGIPEVMVAIASCQSAIALCQMTLTSKIEAVQLDLGCIRKDMDKVRSRLTTAEGRIGHVEDTVAEHDGVLRMLQSKMKTLKCRAKDAKNRFRRNNIHIIGLAEGAEGKNPRSLWRNSCAPFFPAAQLSSYFTVERAHRKPLQGAPPRTFILLAP